MHSLAPHTLMASPRLPQPRPCSPCQLETQQPKLTFSVTGYTWCIGTKSIPLLSAGERLPRGTGSCPRSNGEHAADTGTGPRAPPDGTSAGRSVWTQCRSAVLTNAVCPRRQAAWRRAGNSVARAGSLRADVIFKSQFLSHFCRAATGSAVC